MSWDELGAAVRRRRRELGLTQPEVRERGGPSVETQRHIENNRAGRLSPRMRRLLEEALEWAPGSVDAILAGGKPAPVEPGPEALPAAAAVDTPPAGGKAAPEPPPAEPPIDRFSMAREVVALKTTFAAHADAVAAGAREVLVSQINRSAREAEVSIINVMPWLDDAERGEAIDLLVQLRAPL